MAGLYAAHEENTRGDGSAFTVLGEDVITVAAVALNPSVGLAAQPGDAAYAPVADGMTYLRGDYSFMGAHFANNTYQPPETEQDKRLLNLPLGWRNDDWDAAMWMKNVTDEAYSAQTPAPIIFTGTAAEFLEAPRTYGVTRSRLLAPASYTTLPKACALWIAPSM